MKVTSLPPYVVSACFLTDTVAIEADTLEDLDVDIDIDRFQKIDEQDFSGEESSFSEDGPYVLIPEQRCSGLVSRISSTGNSMMTQEILEFLSSDILETTPEMESKSYRISSGSYVGLAKQSYEQDTSLANVVRKRFRDRILNFVDRVEGHLDVKEDKVEFLLSELEDWVDSDRSPRKYNLSNNYRISEDDEDLIKGEDIIVKEFVNRKMKEELSEEAFEVYKDEFIDKFDISEGIESWNFLDEIQDMGLDIEVIEDDGQLELNVPRGFPIRGEWKSIQEYKEFIDSIENGDQIDSTFWDVLGGGDILGSSGKKEQLGFSAAPLGDELLCFEIDLDENNDLLIESVPLSSDNFKEELVEKKKQQWVEEIIGEVGKKEDIQQQVEELTDQGEWQKAKDLNEKIVALEELDNYLYFVASLLSSIQSKVITVRGIKNIMLFVEALNELYGIDDILMEE